MRYVFEIEQEQEFMACIAKNAGCHHQRLCNPPSLVVLTGEDIPQQPVPEVVSQRQMWEELIERGMLEAAKSASQVAGPIMENYFMRSNEYQRSHPKTAEAIALFGMTPEQGDDLFQLAATL